MRKGSKGYGGLWIAAILLLLYIRRNERTRHVESLVKRILYLGAIFAGCVLQVFRQILSPIASAVMTI